MTRGIQEKRDTEKEGYRRGGIRDWRDTGNRDTGKQGSGGCGTVEMLERRDTGMERLRKEGRRKGGMMEIRDERKEGFRTGRIQDWKNT